MCHGIKWVLPSVPDGHFLFDVPQPCPKCNTDQVGLYLSAILGVSVPMQADLEQRTNRTRDNAEALSAAKKFQQSYKGMMTVSGPDGSGKTRLAASIVLAAYHDGRSAYYVRMPELLRGIADGYHNDVSADKWRQVEQMGVLVVDDLRPGSNAWERREVERIIQQRYDMAFNEHGTVFCTGCAVTDFPSNIQSRLTDRRCTVVRIVGPDLRRIRE